MKCSTHLIFWSTLKKKLSRDRSQQSGPGPYQQQKVESNSINLLHMRPYFKANVNGHQPPLVR